MFIYFEVERIEETRVAPGYCQEQLLPFFRAPQTSPAYIMTQ